jgi:tRNA-dihydrouridine synthase
MEGTLESGTQRRKFPPQFRMYLKPEDLHNFGKLKQIAKREGRPVAEVVRELVEGYVRLHEPGNPQQRLDVVLKTGKAYHAPSPICQVRDCMRNIDKVLAYRPSRKSEYKEVGMCAKHASWYLHEFPLAYSVLMPEKRGEQDEATKQIEKTG